MVQRPLMTSTPSGDRVLIVEDDPTTR
ncbi:MAG: hypothetical protein HW394_865, partial [Acidobacteria bacterium]|nr:hypothetical protein [Acidobacteriota bacterium]